MLSKKDLYVEGRRSIVIAQEQDDRFEDGASLRDRKISHYIGDGFDHWVQCHGRNSDE